MLKDMMSSKDLVDFYENMMNAMKNDEVLPQADRASKLKKNLLDIVNRMGKDFYFFEFSNISWLFIYFILFSIAKIHRDESLLSKMTKQVLRAYYRKYELMTKSIKSIAQKPSLSSRLVPTPVHVEDGDDFFDGGKRNLFRK